MYVVLLGAAAGGGFPQWNCWCPSCRTARTDPAAAHPRTQSSLAVSPDRRRWFLVNASPDVRVQLDRLAATPPDDVRHVPVDGIVFTDAELDHTLGLALLREGGTLHVYATAAVLDTIERDSRLLPVTRAFADVTTTTLEPGCETILRDRNDADTGLSVRTFPVAGDPPRFATADTPGHTIGVELHDRTTGGACAFIPGCGALDAPLLEQLAHADAILLDGTFFTDDELVRLGIGARRATEMGHAPITGSSGTLNAFAALPASHKVYTHINNTNPILIERSAERRTVEQAGIVVGMDGMQFVI